MNPKCATSCGPQRPQGTIEINLEDGEGWGSKGQHLKARDGKPEPLTDTCLRAFVTFPSASGLERFMKFFLLFLMSK